MALIDLIKKFGGKIFFPDKDKALLVINDSLSSLDNGIHLAHNRITEILQQPIGCDFFGNPIKISDFIYKTDIFSPFPRDGFPLSNFTCPTRFFFKKVAGAVDFTQLQNVDTQDGCDLGDGITVFDGKILMGTLIGTNLHVMEIQQ